MKKRLLAIALVLMLALTLLPTAAYATEGGENTQNEIIRRTCSLCKQYCDQEIIRYTPNAGWGTDNELHYVTVKCSNCRKENTFRDSDYKYSLHTGGTETPTCTTGKTCEKCHGEYGILGHDWDVWRSNNDNKTHIRTCKRDGCTAFETENCGGDGNATCVTMGTCTVCGQQYYGGHTFPARWKWASDTDVGRDTEKHWLRCLNCKEGKAYENTHSFGQGNMYLKSAATCISPPVYYTSCGTCYYKGTDTYVDQWGQLDPKNHDGGTEIKSAKAATCTEKGYTGDTYCKGCGVKLSDGKEIPVTGHDLNHVPASAATSRVNGNIEYWHCEGCGKYYADAKARTEITQASTVIPATGRRPAPTTPAASVSSPKTGDAGVALYAGMAILSLTGCAWLRRKEQ